MIVLRYSVLLVLVVAVLLPATNAQHQPARPESVYLLKPARVFDGESAQLHEGWAVLVRGQKIEAVGPLNSVATPKDAQVINLPGLTLLQAGFTTVRDLGTEGCFAASEIRDEGRRGLQTVDGGQWSVVSGQWSVVSYA